MPDSAAKKKEIYDKRNAKGLCIRCGEKATDGVLCALHGRERTQGNRERRSSIIKYKDCIDCKKKLDDNRLTRCKECLLVNAVSAKKRRMSGKHLEKARQYRANIKNDVFEAYGGWICACCGNNRKEMLSIDHKEGKGNYHRRNIGHGHPFYMWLKRNKYPSEFQVLCMSCNFAKRYSGICPHEEEERFIIGTSGAVGDKIGTIDVEKAAIPLGRLCRFAGNGSQFFSVLVHSLVVSDLAPDSIKLLALVHDVSETVISDVPTPFKVPELAKIENRIQLRLYKSLGLNPSKEDFEQLKIADHRAFLGEIGTVATNKLRKYYPGRDQEAEETVTKYLSMYTLEDTCTEKGRAVQEFIKRFKELKGQK